MMGWHALQPGKSTIEDVVRLMGRPASAWDEPGGGQVLEFPQAPLGHQTWMVEIGSDGHFRAMRNVLTPENFARLVPGTSRDAARRLLGSPTETVRFALRPDEEVWSWRFQASPPDSLHFNAYFGPDGRLRRTDTTRDPSGPHDTD